MPPNSSASRSSCSQPAKQWLTYGQNLDGPSCGWRQTRLGGDSDSRPTTPLLDVANLRLEALDVDGVLRSRPVAGSTTTTAAFRRVVERVAGHLEGGLVGGRRPRPSCSPPPGAGAAGRRPCGRCPRPPASQHRNRPPRRPPAPGIDGGLEPALPMIRPRQRRRWSRASRVLGHLDRVVVGPARADDGRTPPGPSRKVTHDLDRDGLSLPLGLLEPPPWPPRTSPAARARPGS